MRSRFVPMLFGLALAALLALPGPGLAAKHKAQAKSVSDTHEKAVALLEKTCKALTELKGFKVHALVTLDKVYRDGSKIRFARDMEITAKRPGFFRVVTNGDDLMAETVYDGKTFILALPDRKVYGQLNFTGDTDALLNELARQYGLEAPLGDLLSGNPCQTLTYEAAYYIGKSKVNGVVCDHLFFQDKDVDWQIWIDSEKTGLPLQFLITEKGLPMAPQFVAVFSGWQSDESPAETFVYKPGEGFNRDDAVITGPAKQAKKAKKKGR
ncbi:DUF2092 domain-containing protein [Fundidesulfovibrio butyratiphilus]